MDAESILDKVVALEEALAIERAKGLEIAAALAVARAKASEDSALIAQRSYGSPNSSARSTGNARNAHRG